MNMMLTYILVCVAIGLLIERFGRRQNLILAGMGVGLLPADRQPRPGVALLPLTDPDVQMRAYARTRRGRTAWPPLALILDRLTS